MSDFHISSVAFQWLRQKTAHLIYLIYVMHSHSILIKYIGPGELLCGDFRCLSERKGIISTPRLIDIFK